MKVGKMTSTDLFHVKFSLAPYETFVEKIIEKSKNSSSSYVCVANVHMLVEAYRDEDFAKQVRNADIITPDGLPITWALYLLHNIKQDRVAGMDLLPDLLKRAEADKLPVFFYGGTKAMLDKTREHISRFYPALRLAGMYSPPFRQLNEKEEQEVVHLINNSRAKLIFVVLGCPKQEKWMASMKNRIHGTMIGIGGALPVLIGMQKRAPLWMQKTGLEWFFRLLKDPRRLWKRYFVTNSIFLYLLFKDKTRSILTGKSVVYKPDVKYNER